MERIKRFTELYENELAMLSEGRAFVNAARKAKDEGLTEFEFNGKKYPVTIKDKEVSESYKVGNIRNPYAFYDSYETMEKELKQLKKITNPKPHIIDKIKFLEDGIQNRVLDEAVSPKVGDNFVHPVYSDIKGKVLLGPDTFEKIEKAGFDMPDLEDINDVDSIKRKEWFGVNTKDGNKIGIHTEEIIKESVTESVNEAASKSVIKRQYTEGHPPIEIQNYAPIREKVLNFLKENGTVTRAQLKEFINGMNEDIGSKTSMKWVNKNSRYIKEFATKGEVHYKLTPLGKRVVERIMIK